MQSDLNAGPDGFVEAHSLKEFRSAGRGSWHTVSDSDWNDWRWQLANRIRDLQGIHGAFGTGIGEEESI